VVGAQFESVACDFTLTWTDCNFTLGFTVYGIFGLSTISWISIHTIVAFSGIGAVTGCWWNSLYVVQFTIICLVCNCDFSLRLLLDELFVKVPS